MNKIGLLSDTHGWLNPKIAQYFSDCNEIWHAGDIGSLEVINELEKIALVRAVYGNIDGLDVRYATSEKLSFEIEKVKVFITHIGGYPGKYVHSVEKEIKLYQPKLFISGHSHILKVMWDKNYNLLHINPGAAGQSGFHTKQTIVTFIVDGEQISDLMVIEL
ncbi:MAG TPA: metallophosphoesterase family protein [Salinivirgaceae bacterium]|nr:metallophosphoesterase family protein [Salinivirgaceae bacterium]